MEILAKYFNFCPNCGGIISDNRLKASLFCESCLKEIKSEINIDKPLWYYQDVELINMKDIKNFFDKIDEFKDFFEKVLQKSIWSLQFSWAKRFFLGYSFSMIAPTGVWKTTWGLIMWLYNFLANKKVYYILPTNLLVEHTYKRFVTIAERNKINLTDVIIYSSKLKKKEKEEVKQKIQKGNFKVLFTTTNFLYKNFLLFNNVMWNIDFIFVDDVDSLLKSWKNIDYVLKLLWFDDNDLQIWYELMKLKYMLITAKSNSKYYINLLKKVQKLQKDILNKRKKINSILVVSSATAKPRSKKINLLRELLWFEIGRVVSNLRNVVDLYIEKENQIWFESFFKSFWKEIEYYLSMFKNGILIYIPSDWWKDKIDFVVNYLNNLWYKSVSYEEITDEVIEKFRNKEIHILVGLASYRNPLTRWIDLPDIAKYAVFFWVPKFVFSPSIQSSVKVVLAIVLSLERIAQKYDFRFKSKIEKAIYEFVPFLKKIQNYTMDYILSNSQYEKKYKEVISFLEKVLADKEVIDILQKSDEIAFDWKNFIIADIAAYLQASGRVSRMYPWGLTKWISLILVDNRKAFQNLKKKIKWFVDEIKFEELKAATNS